MAKIASIIVAAGTGERFKKDAHEPDVPKQYCMIKGHSMLWHATKPFHDHPEIDRTVCVIHTKHATLYYETQKNMHLETPITGGNTRQESVKKALEFFAANNPPDFVLIHDAARPLVEKQDIDRVIDALKQGHKGVSLSYQAADTYRRGVFKNRECFAGEYVLRENLFALQTPQGFAFKPIYDAHCSTMKKNHTDDTSVLSSGGHEVLLIDGRLMNIKVTTPDDIRIAERLIG